MNHPLLRSVAFVFLSLVALPLCRAGEEVIPLWPEGIPDATPGIPAEKWSDESWNGVVTGRAELLENISEPSLTVFRPAAGKAVGSAVVISPGGGYWLLAWKKEGVEIAQWFAERGVTAFVLKYRHRQSKHPAPLRDVCRAIRIVRSRAAEFAVDPARIGAMGFSAGGHLTATAGTLFDAPEAKTGHALDAVSARPDFLVLIYSVLTFEAPHAHSGSRETLLGKDAPADLVHRLSPTENVTAATPPSFLLVSGEDDAVPSESPTAFYLALRKAKVPAELHVFTRGPHGHGMRKGFGPVDVWPTLLEAWLEREGWLKRR
ncbi:alpha/beta hydrolase [Nibricoccus sp. IMCC34717]|uniref:alpha/beta hydrolase n=1 Tax=Nibricoccus sp. IMCC34717 TaxID=3034021 RepID=UPI00384F6561